MMRKYIKINMQNEFNASTTLVLFMIRVFIFCLISKLSLAALVSQTRFSEQNKIEVCFAGGMKENLIAFDRKFKPLNWNNELRKKIQTWISEEYYYERVGVDFFGFKDCTDSPQAELGLFFSDISNLKLEGLYSDYSIESSNSLNFEKTNLKKLKGIVVISTSVASSLKSVIIHEIGHALGLQHEHIRGEASFDSRCWFLPEVKRESTAGKIVLDVYDSQSVMNYCHIFNNKPVGLSVKDIKTLRHLYLGENLEKAFDLKINLEAVLSTYDRLLACQIAFESVGKASEYCFKSNAKIEKIHDCSKSWPEYTTFKGRLLCIKDDF